MNYGLTKKSVITIPPQKKLRPRMFTTEKMCREAEIACAYPAPKVSLQRENLCLPEQVFSVSCTQVTYLSETSHLLYSHPVDTN